MSSVALFCLLRRKFVNSGHCDFTLDGVVGRVVHSRLAIHSSAGLNPFSSGVAL